MESEDINREIFLRIPWRSLARFKSVSKDWFRLISQPSFIQNYQSINLSFVGLFFSNKFIIKFIQIDGSISQQIPCKGVMLPHLKDFIVTTLNCSNGLLLCYSFNEALNADYYTIWNPITRQDIIPPKLLPREAIEQQPRRPFIVQGFAFDPSASKPCVIVIEVYNTKQGWYVNTFTSETHEWRQTLHRDVAALLGSAKDCALAGPSTLLKGCFHWLSIDSGVVAYDIKAKRFRLIRIPCDWNKGHPFKLHRSVDGRFPLYLQYRYLGESQDHLVYTRIAGGSELFLWTQVDYYRNIWSPMHWIIMSNLPAPLTTGSILTFDRKDAQVVYLTLNKKVISYHLANQEFKELQDLTEDTSHLSNCAPYFCSYQLPRSPPSIPPQQYCNAVFGDFLKKLLSVTSRNNIRSH